MKYILIANYAGCGYDCGDTEVYNNTFYFGQFNDLETLNKKVDEEIQNFIDDCLENNFDEEDIEDNSEEVEEFKSRINILRYTNPIRLNIPADVAEVCRNDDFSESYKFVVIQTE